MSVLEPGDLGFNAEYPKKSRKNLCDEKNGTALAVPDVPGMPPLGSLRTNASILKITNCEILD